MCSVVEDTLASVETVVRSQDKLGFKLEGVLAKAVVRCGVARDVSTRAILRDDVMLSSVEEAEEDEGAE